ncbi:MAG: GNAT family N-acetyltransferase [Cytophagales bacterium]|nr:GNAT family N-acetyltransferase [Cytophagales bacterium]
MITVRKIESRDDLKLAFEVREEVFIVEQEVDREEEFDEFEEASVHFLAVDEHSEHVGTARWRTTKKGVKLERFAVRKPWRGKGAGTALVKAVVDDVRNNFNTGELLYLHAQLDAVPLYAKFGFVKKGEQFLECDIWHFEMEKLLD